jgi:hypothetical protein
MFWLLLGSFVGLSAYCASFVISFTRMDMPLLEATIASFSALYLIGVWLVTTEEQGGFDANKKLPAAVAMWALAAAIACHVVLPFVAQWSWKIDFGLGFFSNMIALAGMIALLVHLGRLAARIPAVGLVKQTRFVLWGHVFLGAFACTMMLLMIIMLNASGYLSPAMIAPVGVYMLTDIALSIWLIVLLFKFRRAIAIAIHDARAAWSRDVNFRDVYRGGRKIGRIRS